MKGRDNIEELFQKELGNYQAKVNPELWKGIQAGIQTGAVAGTTAGSSIGVLGKTIIGIVSVAAITTGIILVNQHQTQNDKSVEIHKDIVQENEPTEFSIQENVDSFKENQSTIEEVKQVSTVQTEESISDNSVEDDFSTPQRVEIDNAESVISYEETAKESTPSSINSRNELQGQSTSHVVDDNSNFQNIEIGDISYQQKGQFVQFSVSEIPQDASIVWNFGDGRFERTSNPDHIYESTGTFQVQLTVDVNGQKIVRETTIQIEIQGEIANLPNIFTPNGDGNNDEFFVTCSNIKTFQITVMDQNQNVVFTSNDSDFRWDGNDLSGNPVKDGTYLYIIVAKDNAGNTINKYQRLQIKR